MINYELHTDIDSFNRRLSHYPEQITTGFSECLTQLIATYEIMGSKKIRALSTFCDIVAISIETQIINAIYNHSYVIDDDFSIEVYEGQDLRYLHYPELIKSSILHSIRMFKIAFEDEYDEQLKIDRCEWLDSNVLEELADNVAYYIEILTNRNQTVDFKSQ